jgi:surface protein
MGDEVITIQVTNEILPDAYYNSKDEKINLFEIDFTSYAIYSNTDNSLTFIVSTTEPIVGETYNNKNITNVYTGFELAHYEENGTPWDAVKTQITRVDFIHEIKPISTAHWFQGMTKCIEINCEKLNTENVTDMSAMFSGCKLLEVADVSRFNTSKVTSLYDMFYNCRKLNRINVSNWDTSNVENMSCMFNNCKSLESINFSNWDVSNVKNMRLMFYKCKSLELIELLPFMMNQ